MDASKGRQVLPKNVKPLHYNLVLEPNFSDFTFHGTVDIDLEVLEDSTSIALNTNELDIHATSLVLDGARADVAAQLSYEADSQTTTIEFGGPVLKAGQKARLSHRFTGKLGDGMAGFYRSSWKDKDGTEHWMAVTQMESTDARRAFPCFDEPALKATFAITLVADHNMTCLSNMDVASEAEVESQVMKGKRKAVAFNRTPLMSTYLVACVVGELQVYETNKFRLPVRTYCTPDENIQHLVYATELAAETLEFYEREFDIPYPLPKMDMIAVPDFAAGAMENWGLMTYRNAFILLDDKTSTAADKREVAETVQHELAHQWFGNIVTMDFWEGLWLKEGFATWMSWYSCDIFYPDWKVWDGHVTNSLREALSLDSLRSSHPIEVPVQRTDEIEQIFDSISYEKGSCMIRMLSTYMGEDVFMRGIRLYLKKHAYGNTVTDDLWAALSEASGKDIETFASIWTRNVGYPVVTVSEDSANNTIHLRQNRFLQTADVKPEEDQVLYPVILGTRTKTHVDRTQILTTREGSFKLPDLDFFKLNADHTNTYRTLYSTSRLEKLGQDARNGLLSVSDRAGLIGDAGSLAQAGYQKTSALLTLLRSFDSEPDYEVWKEINTRVKSLKAAFVFEEEEVKKALDSFHRSIVARRAYELGWQFGPEDGHIEQQFKTLMFSAACQAGDEKAVSAARDMFERFKNGEREAIQPNIRLAVFSAVLHRGGKEEYEFVVREYETSVINSERLDALTSLGAGQDPELIQRTLEYILSNHVKSQDLYYPLLALRRHAPGITASWAWLKENWEVLEKKLPSSTGVLGRLMQQVVCNFTKEEQRREVEEVFSTKNTRGIDMDLAQALDEIRSKEGWLSRDRGDVESYLRQSGYF